VTRPWCCSAAGAAAYCATACLACCLLLTSQNASTDGHIAGEGALLVNVVTCTASAHSRCRQAHVLTHSQLLLAAYSACSLAAAELACTCWMLNISWLLLVQLRYEGCSCPVSGTAHPC
jgi:hypothetical protein